MSRVVIKWDGDAIASEINGTAAEALGLGANLILENAVQDAPVETGALRESGRATLNGTQIARGKKNKKINVGINLSKRVINYNKKAAKGATAIVSFDTPYAVRQHEELGYNHPGGGKAKYLEDAFNANKDDVVKLIQDHLKGKLGG